MVYLNQGPNLPSITRYSTKRAQLLLSNEVHSVEACAIELNTLQQNKMYHTHKNKPHLDIYMLMCIK